MELVNLKSGGREEKTLTAQVSIQQTILELEETGPLLFPWPPPGGASPLAGGRGVLEQRGVSQMGVTLLLVKTSKVLPRSYS